MKLFTVTGAISGYSWITTWPWVVLTVAWYVLLGTMQIGCRAMNVCGPVCVDVTHPASADARGVFNAWSIANPEPRAAATTMEAISSGIQGRRLHAGGSSVPSSVDATMVRRARTFVLLTFLLQPRQWLEQGHASCTRGR